MKGLGLQLFIDDIIGSCNFTSFSIMTSTREYKDKADNIYYKPATLVVKTRVEIFG